MNRRLSFLCASLVFCACGEENFAEQEKSLAQKCGEDFVAEYGPAALESEKTNIADAYGVEPAIDSAKSEAECLAAKAAFDSTQASARTDGVSSALGASGATPVGVTTSVLPSITFITIKSERNADCQPNNIQIPAADRIVFTSGIIRRTNLDGDGIEVITQSNPRIEGGILRQSCPERGEVYEYVIGYR